jgi:general secretion pathway protein I
MGREGLRAGNRESGIGNRLAVPIAGGEPDGRHFDACDPRVAGIDVSPALHCEFFERGGCSSAQTDFSRAEFPCGGRRLASIPDSLFPIPGARASARFKGFTLLEVLIALLILALVLVALIRTAGLQAQALAHQRDSTLAQWVAANVAAELRADGVPPVGRQRGEERMGEQRWRWQADTSDTDVERLRRIEIQVFEVSGDAGLADPEGDPVARLTAFATP